MHRALRHVPIAKCWRHYSAGLHKNVWYLQALENGRVPGMYRVRMVATEELRAALEAGNLEGYAKGLVSARPSQQEEQVPQRARPKRKASATLEDDNLRDPAPGHVVARPSPPKRQQDYGEEGDSMERPQPSMRRTSGSASSSSRPRAWTARRQQDFTTCIY